MILIISILIIGVSYFCLFLTGMISYDLRQIKNERQSKRHPYAKRWRKRPVISLASENTTPIKQWRREYRKIREVKPGKPAIGDLVLYVPKNIEVVPGSIIKAVRDFNADDSLISIELPHPIKPTTALTEIFSHYHHMATWPIALLRMGLHIQPMFSQRAVLVRKSKYNRSGIDTMYRILEWLVSFSLSFILIYITYTATALGESSLLFAYVAAGLAWAAWAIASYDGLSPAQRLGYIFLLPSVFIYFAIRIILAPLRILTTTRLTALRTSMLS